MTDPIADMLTRIRNAQAAKKPEVLMPYSKLKHTLADILATEGFISSVSVDDGEGSVKKMLTLGLKYSGGKPVIRRIDRISTPGRRVYVGVKKLPYVFDNLGIAIISTSKGLMSNKQARKERMGGEVICEVF
ncbi:MAG: 30S ribosomal protein S8 [Candidatus Kerfeldbacteria bacterium CG15_BIG_FIL_POST_REV_8_21_14_020_45_12]|uniref:Small ribosomal subunit protein uS8 n=1 Tax=Candidatus Kerfeldbacteria bacterium CG15_BIG_FIL_POST_REV_8_21_14_020_45_12 TaxID=2014247 RepID=A0A2M7H3S3_9BACT|nr:MAG: 30S ribosomal protein S8 [Candidatus Kerfeldbacteria bacterium CG15_BIG_FIL_POST_REV_8_21_14_020_45_12]PJA93998.1 MAG: 30S ribosomal protein S8 [Candidatus Kerfeldbacteria bacterium CG_4_9_14_3_um_filter_45_8]